jgi:transcription-repair coupling factor (superfamily II helicase)
MIRDGRVQIIIATHSILSSRIKFRDLGMVIIDEEQHFGVKQKEILKGGAHMMTLSATPIPRTLQMAMTGIKDLSIIATPPPNRLPVKITACSFSREAIKGAIENELSSGGQVFFVTPRIEYLDSLHELVTSLLPDVRIAKVHGQTSDLDRILQEFCGHKDGHKIDILISTNIIDSGIDIPNANTILIHRFDLFGLSQLYQLCGRVGRSNKQAHAYLLIEDGAELSERAQKRLDVILNSTGLASGFALAWHDLDIRGAGNLLGKEQAGHIKDLGTELYQSMLEEAIMMLKSGKMSRDFDPQINLGIPTLIPRGYIADSNLRLSFYRKIGGLDGIDGMESMRMELFERFGRIPEETQSLLSLTELKIICRQIGIDRLDVGGGGLTFSFAEGKPDNPSLLLEALNSGFVRSNSGAGRIRKDGKVVITKSWRSLRERQDDVRMILLHMADALNT